jgi:hypothetical protein
MSLPVDPSKPRREFPEADRIYRFVNGSGASLFPLLGVVSIGMFFFGSGRGGTSVQGPDLGNLSWFLLGFSLLLVGHWILKSCAQQLSISLYQVRLLEALQRSPNKSSH